MIRRIVILLWISFSFISRAFTQYSNNGSKFLGDKIRFAMVYTHTDSLKDTVKAIVFTDHKIKETRNSSYWISIGIGKSYAGPTFNGSLSYAYNENIFTVRYLKADEFQFNVEGHYDNPTLSYKEIGVLYGRCYDKDYVVLSLLVGIGFVDGIDRGKNIEYHEYEKRIVSTYGVPFEAKIRIEITNYFGIGSSFFGNLNSEKSFSGGLFEIYVGKF